MSFCVKLPVFFTFDYAIDIARHQSNSCLKDHQKKIHLDSLNSVRLLLFVLLYFVDFYQPFCQLEKKLVSMKLEAICQYLAVFVSKG